MNSFVGFARKIIEHNENKIRKKLWSFWQWETYSRESSKTISFMMWLLSLGKWDLCKNFFITVMELDAAANFTRNYFETVCLSCLLCFVEAINDSLGDDIVRCDWRHDIGTFTNEMEASVIRQKIHDFPRKSVGKANRRVSSGCVWRTSHNVLWWIWWYLLM